MILVEEGIILKLLKKDKKLARKLIRDGKKMLEEYEFYLRSNRENP
ncbi:MAG: hypothetical protein QXJ25_02335 [Candidatus Aenigmatarchaeota archaeon]